jgi:hypothetical protein
MTSRRLTVIIAADVVGNSKLTVTMRPGPYPVGLNVLPGALRLSLTNNDVVQCGAVDFGIYRARRPVAA